MSTEEIESAVKAYILDEFLPGEDPEELTDTTELIGSGILDSIATLKLVDFLGEKFGVEILPHETGIDYLNTISDIAELVRSKSE